LKLGAEEFVDIGGGNDQEVNVFYINITHNFLDHCSNSESYRERSPRRLVFCAECQRHGADFSIRPSLWDCCCYWDAKRGSN
jgi:hypothetical protein